MDKRNIFLLDGVGALISTLFLGIILPYNYELIGLPKSTLYFLSIFPLLFCFYSFGCFTKIKTLKPYHYFVIAFLNLSYCTITVFTVARFLGGFTDLGYIYFLIELIIILILAAYEMKVGILLYKMKKITEQLVS